MADRRVPRRTFLAAMTGAGGLAAAAGALPARAPGEPLRAYGERSPHEKSARYFRESVPPGSGVSYTPLQDLYGILTPSSLHFERHHAGVPQIDPRKHELLVHGLVERPLLFTIDEVRRLPSVTRIHFIECAGNTGSEHRGGTLGPTPQRTHGLLSCSEWTGVSLRLLLEEAGLQPDARWVVAEGADACRLARSVPLEKALDDVIVAYGQNGESLRPEQGYPLRLVVPGWEGNVWIKWLDRLHVTNRPSMHRAESRYYTDLLPDGTSRIFTFVMEAKSVITRPAGGQTIARGFHEITGLAWSGRGVVRRVEVSTDGGATWSDAALQEPVLPKAITRFRHPWRWDGSEAVLQSRCTDETGYVQPTRAQLVAVRGPHATDHYNGIKSWKVRPDGKVISV